jgi:MEDS: MEthanogen/methylotroph, DcmR Sensory domain
MSEASTEFPRNLRDISELEIGTHAGYVFESNADKQVKLFALCKDSVLAKNCGLLYIAGKQGVKGIRLSFIDTGFDVAACQRNGQMRIVDSEEWYLTALHKLQFKSVVELESEFRKAAADTIALGFSFLVVISETDMIVRKGFLQQYAEFDAHLGKAMRDLKTTFVCAFDRRELLAAGIKDPEIAVSHLHPVMI